MKKNKYWFRPKIYGYGLKPVSWEGWLLTFLLLAILLIWAKIIGIDTPRTGSETQSILEFIFGVIIMAFVFVRLSEPRCDGKIKWRWGDKK